jgi:hypothetical protein
VKSGLAIGVIAGVLIGAGVMYFIAQPDSRVSGNNVAGTAATPAGAMAGSPLVGIWRLDLPPMKVTYNFKDDGTFTQRFTSVPVPPLGQATSHEARGAWSVHADTLTMQNTSSTTPFTIVGEEESATIVSTTRDQLVLLNVNRKGKKEKLTLARIEPFVPGKCDNPAIVAEWESPNWGRMELKPGGAAMVYVRNMGSFEGRWMQHADALRLMIDPPKDSDTRPRRWDPRVHEEQEWLYQILEISSDGQSMRLRGSETQIAPASEPLTFLRTTLPAKPQSQTPPQRRRPSGMKE